eukprot:TRINITY_DN110538_c0_g1_i1.p1 TRINITY_DN110538_c0_g1~~TRINITY_DN110538_c0_g1_i1.p1  ORF type:complete len:206 (+),score=30.39 TRINITY_DN110538_c0_g1_i1:32-649(+)
MGSTISTADADGKTVYAEIQQLQADLQEQRTLVEEYRSGTPPASWSLWKSTEEVCKTTLEGAEDQLVFIEDLLIFLRPQAEIFQTVRVAFLAWCQIALQTKLARSGGDPSVLSLDGLSVSDFCGGTRPYAALQREGGFGPRLPEPEPEMQSLQGQSGSLFRIGTYSDSTTTWSSSLASLRLRCSWKAIGFLHSPGDTLKTDRPET